jgi:hypothetical protein
MKTLQPVTQPGGTTAFGNIKPGDTVEVRTTDGRSARFVVQQVEADAIVGPNGERYKTAEITHLKRRSFSGAKTAGLVAGIAGGLLLVYAWALANALGDIWTT